MHKLITAFAVALPLVGTATLAAQAQNRQENQYQNLNRSMRQNQDIQQQRQQNQFELNQMQQSIQRNQLFNMPPPGPAYGPGPNRR